MLLQYLLLKAFLFLVSFGFHTELLSGPFWQFSTILELLRCNRWSWASPSHPRPAADATDHSKPESARHSTAGRQQAFQQLLCLQSHLLASI